MSSVPAVGIYDSMTASTVISPSYAASSPGSINTRLTSKSDLADLAEVLNLIVQLKMLETLGQIIDLYL